MNFLLTVKNLRFSLKKLLSDLSSRQSQEWPELCYAVNTLEKDIKVSQKSKSPLGILSEIIDNGFLWAVPKSRRSLERRMMRRMGFGKMLLPKKNLMVCDTCGHYHPVHTICGNCYEKVKQETEIMQEAIMKELKLDPIDKEVVILYENDPKDGKTFEGKRIVEVQKERPSWFSRNLLAKDSEIPRERIKAVGSAYELPSVSKDDK